VVLQKVFYITFSVAFSAFASPSCVILPGVTHTHIHTYGRIDAFSYKTRKIPQKDTFSRGAFVLLCVGLKGLGFYRMGLCVWEYTLGSLLMEWWHLHTRFLLSYGATVQCIRIYHTLDWRGVFFLLFALLLRGRAG
jgi:hypothetical protein